MRFLFVYRGQCDRVLPERVRANFLVKIQEPLLSSGDTFDCIMTTPKGQRTFEAWKTIWNPLATYEIPEGTSKQAYTLHQVLKFLLGMDLSNYDWIVFLRYDVIYRVSFPAWGIHEKPAGVVVPFLEESLESWNTRGYVSDVVFAISPEKFSSYLGAFEQALANFDTYFFHGTLHQHPAILDGSGIPWSTMFPGFYQSNTARRPEGPLMGADDPRLSPFHVILSKPNYAGYHMRDCFSAV